jgi:putative DNA primase/helicase
MNDTATLKAALQYAKRGWVVHPLLPGGKKPRTNWGRDASRDPGKIHRWFEGSDRNVGIVTGEPSGLCVVDVDGSIGEASLARYAPLPPTLEVRTPNGRHLYFRWDDRCPGTKADSLGPKLDIRSTGGYVVAPPSVVEGRAYEWAGDWLGEVAPFPDVLRAPAEELEVAKKGLRQAVGKIKAALPSSRNDTLNRQVFLLAKSGAPREVVEPLVKEAALEAGLEPGEIEATFESGWTSGEQAAAEAPSGGKYPPTDEGTAQRLADEHRHHLRWSHERQKWFIWDKAGRWSVEDRAGAVQFARETARAQWADHGGKPASLGSERHVGAALRLARPDLAVRVAELDAHPWLLNCANGVVNLRTGELLDHDPALLLTRQAPTAYSPGAERPLWDDHLRTMTHDRPHLAAFLQRAVGMSLVGEVREHGWLLLLGEGRNGKGVFMRALQGALGSYAHEAPRNLLTEDDTAHSTSRAALQGRRLVSCSEVGSGQLNSATLKALTGGDPVTGRQMRENDQTFEASHTLWLSANRRPRLNDRSGGMWARAFVVELGEGIPEDQQRPAIEDELKAEGEGILAWAVEGCLAWQEEGLSPPVEVRCARDDYQASEDPLADWVDECLELDEAGAWATAEDVHQSLTTWWEWNRARHERQPDSKAVAEELKRRGCLADRRYVDGKRRRTWEGLKLVGGVVRQSSARDG